MRRDEIGIKWLDIDGGQSTKSISKKLRGNVGNRYMDFGLYFKGNYTEKLLTCLNKSRKYLYRFKKISLSVISNRISISSDLMAKLGLLFSNMAALTDVRLLLPLYSSTSFLIGFRQMQNIITITIHGGVSYKVAFFLSACLRLENVALNLHPSIRARDIILSKGNLPSNIRKFTFLKIDAFNIPMHLIFSNLDLNPGCKWSVIVNDNFRSEPILKSLLSIKERTKVETLKILAPYWIKPTTKVLQYLRKPNEIYLYVRTAQPSPIVIPAYHDDTVIKVKERIEFSRGFFSDFQTLLFKGERLRNDRTLKSYNIVQNSTISLTYDAANLTN